MLDFIRSEIIELAAYTTHPGGASSIPVDHLDTNESPYDLPSELKEKLAWIYQHQIETNRYPDGSHVQLKEAIANYVNESASLDQAITPEQISLGNGSDELIRSLLIATCIGGSGSILVANPTFSMYGILAKTLGIPVVSVDRLETDFTINLSEAQKAIKTTDGPPIRVVFVVHPNSPTANALTASELDWLRSLPEQILVVVDEAYFEFSQTSVVAELAKRPHWMILRTFSKAFRLASLRMGYAISHPQVTSALEKVRLPYNLPSFSQTAALFALNHRSQILTSINQILSERERLFNNLAQNPALQMWKSDANFIYLRLQNTTYDLESLTSALKTEGTLVRHTGGGLRITIGSPEENTRTINRLEKLLI